MPLNDDRRVALYRGGRKIATIGDLRHPIALVRATRTPDDKDAFIQTFNPYYKAWAAIDFGAKRSVRGGDNAETESKYQFYIRANPAITINQGDYVVYQDTRYTVRYTSILGTQKEFTVISCVEYEQLTAAQETAANIVEGPPTTSPSTQTGNTKFWDQV